jgi:tripartite-type tricarboxylate transporter receptor subunit TctC
MKRLLLIFAMLLTLTACNKETIVLIVPTNPGGSTDVVARLAARKLSAIDGNNYVVENHFGSTGDIALKTMLEYNKQGRKAILFGYGGTFIFNQFISSDHSDRLANVEILSPVHRTPFALIVSNKSDIHTVGQLVDRIKAENTFDAIRTENPAALYGSNGTLGQLANYYFAKGLNTRVVNYRSNDQIYLAIARGDILYAFVSYVPGITHQPGIRIIGTSNTVSYQFWVFPKGKDFGNLKNELIALNDDKDMRALLQNFFTTVQDLDIYKIIQDQKQDFSKIYQEIH